MDHADFEENSIGSDIWNRHRNSLNWVDFSSN